MDHACSGTSTPCYSNTDADHCGSSCIDCGNHEVCQSSSCVCGSGYHACSGTSTPCYSNTDVNHCGTSCVACGTGATCPSGSCRFPNGSPCSVSSDCIYNNCITYYRDLDGDGFGAQSSGTVKYCGTVSLSNYVTNNSDCCDNANNMAYAAEANPAYTDGPRDYGATGCAKPFDWNCDGVETKAYTNGSCLDYTTQATCPAVVYRTTAVPACGVEDVVSGCGWTGTECSNAVSALITQRCQ